MVSTRTIALAFHFSRRAYSLFAIAVEAKVSEFTTRKRARAKAIKIDTVEKTFNIRALLLPSEQTGKRAAVRHRVAH